MIINTYNINGEKVNNLNLKEDIFELEPNKHVMHEVLVAELASFRSGNASTKTRSMVRGGGRKPWKQKGTGRARQGSIRAPHWVGGGVAFGPAPRDFSKKINKKVRKLAIKSALSSKAKNNEIIVLEDYNLESPSTKKIKLFLDKLNLKNNLFILTDAFEGSNENLYLSTKNIKDNIVIEARNAGVYWLLKQKNVLITKEALNYFEEALE